MLMMAVRKRNDKEDTNNKNETVKATIIDIMQPNSNWTKQATEQFR